MITDLFGTAQRAVILTLRRERALSYQFFNRETMINKKIGLAIIIIVFLVSALSSYAFFSKNSGSSLGEAIRSPLSSYKPPQSNGNGNKSTISSEPKTEECPINGEMLTKKQKDKWEKRRPLGVMIENHKEARPQSGLSMADVVYEAVAEGGITRFLAVYYCKDASYIGPVRSARIYFIRLLQEYADYPLYAHVGGANTPGPADALGYIKTIGWGLYNDLNQFAVPFPYFWRDYERLPGRATEHTVYSSTSKLWQYAKEKRDLSEVDEDNGVWNKNFIQWKFKDDSQLSDRGTTGKIDFGFWTSFASEYAVTWNYEKSTNSYKRVNGGSPHLDKNSGKQLAAKNIVILFTRESSANDGYPGGHILYKVTGSGEAVVFQDGNAITATWNKIDEESRVKFTDDSTGKEIPMVRGQVFIEILPTGNKVNY
ncbi:MAG: hypothetical protein US11_C0001G0051 [Candidatus Roizmanbacteria bacterium GW2011_GWA2_36_23]|uniref:PT repeat-containing protein n=1 Tax=Candidatus Roizmanbacteria bacterium GW2011_GWA2_36_23 TaxID=1618480 RepID=A0A0G0E9C7_9BACT|nr:MAG: hypothetical protein US11_C0001G0051 [Candidatus Roizmanbacteria bacterium GW2011_GWA2_36_23]